MLFCIEEEDGVKFFFVCFIKNQVTVVNRLELLQRDSVKDVFLRLWGGKSVYNSHVTALLSFHLLLSRTIHLVNESVCFQAFASLLCINPLEK